jgi:SAM-dependent methyltransferase
MIVGAPSLFVRSLTAARYAARVGAPGSEFGSFGRTLGLRALLTGERSAFDLLVTPVSIVRYWEFPFVLRHLPRPLGRCLDISSPRLFSFYVASRERPISVRMLNPDGRDAALSKRLANRLGLKRISVESKPVSALEGLLGEYDAIWSISVIEHIPGTGDQDAMRLMYQALAPGGTLAVTVPVDREAHDEYRDEDVYAVGVPVSDRGAFFQRWYDEKSIFTRLLDPLDVPTARLEWFGELTVGRFAEYEKDWLSRGRTRTVDDPREIADWYSSFESWGAMPGKGVCGIVLRKPS